MPYLTPLSPGRKIRVAIPVVFGIAWQFQQDDLMSDDARARRMAVRFTDDDLAWIAEHADDEGVEPATLVRMIINRLRRGRAPLMSMIGTAQHVVASAAGTMPSSSPARRATFDVLEPQTSEIVQHDNLAEQVLADRLADLEGSNVQQLYADDAVGDELQTAAIPLKRVSRQQYNPGRR